MTPKILYHYTTIQTLALILESKKIRFNSIDNMDDLTEPLSKDLGNVGSLVLVSCWTDTSEEDIAQWSLYANNGKGCRIELPSDLFIFKSDKEKSDFLRFENNLYFLINTPFQIEYVKDFETKAIRKKDTFDFSHIGKTKHERWTFQSEWRYIIYQMPREMFDSIDSLKYHELMDFEFKHHYYDMEIRKEAFEQMKIVLGPSVSEADKIIVKALVSAHNKDATVSNSALEIKLKK